MTERIIPIADWRQADLRAVPATTSALPAQALGPLTDSLGRPVRDLRISVTDRCNFRCTYCMPREVFDRNHHFLPRSALLDFDEITRLARLFVEHGVEKIRLTGGEPLLRKDIEKLIAKLAALRAPGGQPIDLTLTTNGSLLSRKAKALRDAGLQRITISLDALDEAIFRRMNDVDFPVAQVLEGIEAAHCVGFAPIKVNMVVQRGINDSQILPMARHFRNSGHTLRFIEYMDVGNTNGWKLDEVIPSAEVIQRISAEFPLEPLDATYPGEVAQRWRYGDGAGEIGVISSVTQAFCRTCTRARLSTEGRLYTCLFATQGFDLRAPLRSGVSDDELGHILETVWRQRNDRYSELRSQQSGNNAAGERHKPDDGTETVAATTPARREKIEMSYIGG